MQKESQIECWRVILAYCIKGKNIIFGGEGEYSVCVGGGLATKKVFVF
jgi:hypothetical protein